MFLFLRLFMQRLPDYVRAQLSMFGIKDYIKEYCLKKQIGSTFLGDHVHKKSTCQSNQPSQTANNLLIYVGIISVLGKTLEAVHQTANIMLRTKVTRLRVSGRFHHRSPAPTEGHYH